MKQIILSVLSMTFLSVQTAHAQAIQYSRFLKCQTEAGDQLEISAGKHILFYLSWVSPGLASGHYSGDLGSNYYRTTHPSITHLNGSDPKVAVSVEFAFPTAPLRLPVGPVIFAWSSGASQGELLFQCGG